MRFVFRRRPFSIPADLRPLWRISLVILILRKCCQRQRSHLRRLHVLNWACSSPENRDEFVALLDGQILPDSIIVRYEPWLDRAIELAEGEGLLSRHGAVVELTPEGMEMASQIMADNRILAPEKEFLEVVGRKASEKAIKELIEGSLGAWG